MVFGNDGPDFMVMGVGDFLDQLEGAAEQEQTKDALLSWLLKKHGYITKAKACVFSVDEFNEFVVTNRDGIHEMVVGVNSEDRQIRGFMTVCDKPYGHNFDD